MQWLLMLLMLLSMLRFQLSNAGSAVFCASCRFAAAMIFSASSARISEGMLESLMMEGKEGMKVMGHCTIPIPNVYSRFLYSKGGEHLYNKSSNILHLTGAYVTLLVSRVVSWGPKILDCSENADNCPPIYLRSPRLSTCPYFRKLPRDSISPTVQDSRLTYCGTKYLPVVQIPSHSRFYQTSFF